MEKRLTTNCGELPKEFKRKDGIGATKVNGKAIVDNLNNERVATLIKKGCGKGFDFDRNPLICGGKFSNGDCYYCPECRQPEECVIGDIKWLRNQIKEFEEEYKSQSNKERYLFIDGKLTVLKLWLALEEGKDDYRNQEENVVEKKE